MLGGRKRQDTIHLVGLCINTQDTFCIAREHVYIAVRSNSTPKVLVLAVLVAALVDLHYAESESAP